jgi:hypothetical protein
MMRSHWTVSTSTMRMLAAAIVLILSVRFALDWQLCASVTFPDPAAIAGKRHFSAPPTFADCVAMPAVGTTLGVLLAIACATRLIHGGMMDLSGDSIQQAYRELDTPGRLAIDNLAASTVMLFGFVAGLSLCLSRFPFEPHSQWTPELSSNRSADIFPIAFPAMLLMTAVSTRWLRRALRLEWERVHGNSASMPSA